MQPVARISWITALILGCQVLSPTLPVISASPSADPFLDSSAKETTRTTNQSSVLRVGIKPIEPFVFVTDAQPYGYSIDLWQAIEPHLDQSTQFVAYDSVPELLAAIREGQVDLGTAALSITADREADGFNFSHPIYEAGLQLVILRQQGTPLAQLIHYLGGREVIWAVSRIVLCSLMVGGLLWLLERDHNPHFKHDPIRGIGQGIWFAIVTLGTFGYGDVTPVRFGGRVIAALWMAVSFFILADFISAMTAARQQMPTIAGIQDLTGQPVGATQGTTAAAFLKTQPVEATEFSNFEQSVRALRAGKVSAILLDRPAAEYFVSRNLDYQMVGERLNLEYYGIAVRENNQALLEAINRAILILQEQGKLEYLNDKWFGK
jgi:ABC-type amino acid transport substrate-binding protein